MVSLTPIAESVVKPSRPTPPQHMFLAAADIFWRWFHYNQRILFFKMPPTSSFVAHLKSSLALALVDFFPWAGRLFEQPNGRLALDCNDAGVPFIEVSIDVPFSSLEIDGFQHKPFFKHLAPHGDVLQWTPDLPLLSVQVTRFLGEEGFVIGIGHNHAVADGSSLWHFMKSWAECARGVPMSLRPIHMRNAQSPENLILPRRPRDDDDDDHLASSNKSITQGGTIGFTPQSGGGDLVQQDFHFSAGTVKKLKDMAVASAAAGEGHHAAAPISSLQALSAHIWKHVTTARGIDKARRCALFLMANMRHRMVPPLPDAYFGNAVMRDGAVALSGELQEESIGRTAVRIGEISSSMDDTRMKTFYGNMEVLQPSALFEGMDFTAPKLQLTSSPRFPAYEVDFGWGPPQCVRCPLIRTDGEMVWFAGREGGGSVDVALALSKSVMERLEQDEGFLS